MSTMELAPLEAAKEAIALKDWEGARALLAPLVSDRPGGLPSFLLARAEFELGRPHIAAPLLIAFRAARPQHVGACVLAGRVFLALGRLDDAEATVREGLAVEPDNKVFPQLLDSIAAAHGVAEAFKHVAVIDNGYLRARRSGPTARMVKAAQALAAFAPGPDWPRDAEQAKIAYFRNATDIKRALRNYDPHLIDVSVRFDYVAWPKRIQEYVRGKSVLDVGCGFGGFGVGFLIAGASSYAGLDPAMDLDSTRAKNKRVRQWDDMGVTPRQIQEALPAIRLFQSSSEDKSFDETFDTIALHNVTEHLMQLEEVFAGLVRLCKPDTNVVFHHHNYYCWNGHHMAPNQPAQLKPDDAKQQTLYDWRHVWAKDQLPESSYVFSNLNQVRLDELRTIVEKYFDIVRWDEIPSSKPTLDRLTPEIMDNVRGVIPDIEERELTVNAVLGVARPKASS
ncbi:methyltransferase domain-containing protein [Nocardioides stalactiti]|uniref:methyltransferase domain-containing protein n=1 Tax=Nocardioides stalactiti TaxID=2755356 RepID=UPI0016005DCC|nr:methyltransferase domain-containing protein [Nocardioides stalactiti]